jgi:hypothetical protein
MYNFPPLRSGLALRKMFWMSVNVSGSLSGESNVMIFLAFGLMVCNLKDASTPWTSLMNLRSRFCSVAISAVGPLSSGV